MPLFKRSGSLRLFVSFLFLSIHLPVVSALSAVVNEVKLRSVEIDSSNLAVAEIGSSTQKTSVDEPVCREVTFRVKVSAKNLRVPTDVVTSGLLTILGQIVVFVFDLVVSGTWDIAGRYCEPEFKNATRAEILVLLVHGATYDKDYWSSTLPIPFPVQLPFTNATSYSQVHHLFSQGYPTLSIDRLGNGRSTRANPILEVQYPTQVSTIHSIISTIRSSDPKPLPRSFQRIVYIGHSYGSIVGNALIAAYPKDVNGVILTGYSADYALGLPGVAINAILAPASAILERFRNLDLGYLTPTSVPGVKYLFFYPSPAAYDEKVFAHGYVSRGTFSVGEAVTAPFGLQIARSFTGHALLLNGNNDVIFCNPLGLNTNVESIRCVPKKGKVGRNFMEEAVRIVPNARSYDGFALENMGHSWQLHRDAVEGYKRIGEWLGSKSF